MYKVFETNSLGFKRPVSKAYPTWLGCKRVRNRIARENRFLFRFIYTVEHVYENY